MQVLLTGAFGNVGISTLEALRERGHSVRCFDLDTEDNRRRAARYDGDVEISWGDLRRPEGVARAVAGQEVVVHLAFIIPKLSATGVESESVPALAWEVNVGGTYNLIEALRAQPSSPSLIFASSYHVYGLTQELEPPRTVDEPVHPVEHYARHKVACEWLIKASTLRWAILRLCAALPLTLDLDPYMFEIPLENRMEFLHTRDAGVAFANAVTCEEVWGRTLLIGGGPRCQLTFRQIVRGVLESTGVGMLPEEAFGNRPFATDWVDSAESERLLGYQSHTFEDYVREIGDRLGARRVLARLFRPLVRRWLLGRSPHWRRAGEGKARRQP
jgi:nucleoside-diphosphate-sugar epimerase